MNRQTLFKIYKCFILPVLEYASEVWDGFSQSDIQRLESLQLEAARIACGLPVFCKKEYVYLESELEPLETRRERKKLVLFYKMHNRLVPSYLSDLLPPLVSQTTNYPLRNNNDYTMPNIRLSLSEKSFLISTTSTWNSLHADVRNKPTSQSFKMALRTTTHKIPAYYLYGKRKSNILHTRLRHNCSSLNYDLFRCNLIPDPSCNCGNPCENAYHFVLECPLYLQQRAIMMNTLSHIHYFNIQLLLSGDESQPLDYNNTIFHAVQQYIVKSKRF